MKQNYAKWMIACFTFAILQYHAVAEADLQEEKTKVGYLR